ncbi:glycosyltransferase family 8 protein [Devosia faecipullorum]|uniref:glycosyltransferase family 8 protein n=1 Tax=Devosia faecipullorum TaxID=2755039 RepID=UPI00187B9106|nr:glycosyltransferase family 8 protein [Devosia faecipullorum]MBE7733192.1 glycosyltransferase family 8 protein [Devosia faecipullorum]
MAVDVVLAGDRKILWGLAVTVRSALEHASEPLNIHVLATGFRPADERALRQSWQHDKCGTVTFYTISSDRTKRFRSTQYLKSKAAYSRYFISALPDHIERCVYLDTDLLVFKDLSEVHNVDLGSNIAAAVRDISVRTRGAWPELRERLGVENELNYVNSGVIIIDLARWRQDDIETALVEISISKFDQMDSQDQDAINIVLYDKIAYLDISWNLSQYEKPEIGKANIIHLIGSVKPWNARYTSKIGDAYFDQILGSFFAVLDRTAYRGYRPWNPMGAGSLLEKLVSHIPTLDMATGKIRRSAKRLMAGRAG